MNTQAFPFEFLQKSFPKLARAEPTFVDSATAEGGSIHTDVAILSATPGFTNEPGIVEIVLRIRGSARIETNLVNLFRDGAV